MMVYSSNNCRSRRGSCNKSLREDPIVQLINQFLKICRILGYKCFGQNVKCLLETSIIRFEFGNFLFDEHQSFIVKIVRL